MSATSDVDSYNSDSVSVDFDSGHNVRSHAGGGGGGDGSDGETDISWVPDEYKPTAKAALSTAALWYDELGRLTAQAVDIAGHLSTEALEWTQDNVIAPYVDPNLDITGGSRSRREAQRKAMKSAEPAELPMPSRMASAEVGDSLTQGQLDRIAGQFREPAEDSLLVAAVRALAPGEKFDDRAFPCTQASLGGTMGKFPEADARVEWIRVTELCKRPIFIKDGVSPGDVKQGLLGDCWFLGALSVVAVQPKLLSTIVCAPKFADRGAYAFFFYKFGKWIEVVVDDRIPCKVRPGYETVPLCAHSADRDETWVMLIEKAYAKLHGCYNALDGGAVPEALMDMTASLPVMYKFETMRAEIDSGKLFTDLKEWVSSGNYLCGTSRAPKEGEASEADTGNGLHVGHAYGVMAVHEYAGSRIVRLRNPWGEGEPRGMKWNDDDKASWTPQAQKDLNHSLGNDGTFLMAYEDYARQFTHLTTSRLLDPTWRAVSVKGVWARSLASAGGSPNAKTFWRNPQYCLHVRNRGEFSLLLSQSETRGTPYPRLFMGLRVFSVGETGPRRLEGYLGATVIVKSTFINTRDQVAEMTLDPGFYTIIPATFEAGKEGLFSITVFSSATFAMGPLDASQNFAERPIPPIDMSTRGTDPTAGGGANVQRNSRVVVQKKLSGKNSSSKKNKRNGRGKKGRGSEDESDASATATDESGDDDDNGTEDEVILENEELADPPGKLPDFVKKRVDQYKKLKSKHCAKCSIQ